MPAKSVISIEGNLRNYGITASDLAAEREILDSAAMAEMLYQGFETEIERKADEEGFVLPPLTDMNGRIIPGQEGQFVRVASSGRPNYKGNTMPASSSEKAIASLMEVRDDMLHQYSSVSQNPVVGATVAMGIQKIEAQIISMGGTIDRFDPAKYQSGLKPVSQTEDPIASANKVVENTQQAYNLKPITTIHAGKNKSGKAGIFIKIASSDLLSVRGTVVPKGSFNGSEVIDYVPDAGKGRMSVKTAINGYWEDVSDKFNIAWVVESNQ